MHYGPPAKGRSTEEVIVSYDENRQDCMLHQQSPEFEPQPDIKISVRPSSQYCNCTKNVINPNKKKKGYRGMSVMSEWYGIVRMKLNNQNF